MGISGILGGYIAPGMERHEVARALAGICMKLQEDLWQSVSIVDSDECGCTVLKTSSEIVARIKFKVSDGVWLEAQIRTDLLAKYQTLFYEELPQLKLSFGRLRPYLDHC